MVHTGFTSSEGTSKVLVKPDDDSVYLQLRVREAAGQKVGDTSERALHCRDLTRIVQKEVLVPLQHVAYQAAGGVNGNWVSFCGDSFRHFSQKAGAWMGKLVDIRHASGSCAHRKHR